MIISGTFCRIKATCQQSNIAFARAMIRLFERLRDFFAIRVTKYFMQIESYGYCKLQQVFTYHHYQLPPENSTFPSDHPYLYLLSVVD